SQPAAVFCSRDAIQLVTGERSPDMATNAKSSCWSKQVSRPSKPFIFRPQAERSFLDKSRESGPSRSASRRAWVEYVANHRGKFQTFAMSNWFFGKASVTAPQSCSAQSEVSWVWSRSNQKRAGSTKKR